MMTTLRRHIAIFLASIISLIFPTSGLSLDRDRTLAQLHYTFWSEKDGAPNEISALAQTEDGFLWIGSERGLFRFDGVTFEEFKPQAGAELPSHSIYSLMATPDGGLWIAFSPNGLGFIKDGTITVHRRQEELPDSPVHCFARDLDGRIWAGTETGLVLRDGTRWLHVGRDWNLPDQMIRYLLVDRQGTLWVATTKMIAYLKRGSRSFKFGGSVGSGVTRLDQAKDGRVWFADDGRSEVSTVQIMGEKIPHERPVVVGDGLRELFFDRDGALWITRMDSGIIRISHPSRLRNRQYDLRAAEVDSFGPKEGFTGGFAYGLLEDREGNVWVGCSKGLVRFRHNDVVPVNLPQRYQNLTLLSGDRGDIWLGTADKRPFLHVQGKNLVPQTVGGQVASVLRAPDGGVFWGCRSGLWQQRGTHFRFFRLPGNAVPDFMWNMIASSADGGFWIRLGDVGFVHFLRGEWDLHSWPKGVPSEGRYHPGPSASYRDSTGDSWLGYSSGQLYVIKGDRTIAFSQKDGLDLGRIKVVRGLGQRIWIGGDLGLALFSNGRFWKVDVADGEPLGAISGIIETPGSGLWLNEMRGIVHISSLEIQRLIANPNHRVSYRRFSYLDGLPGAPQMGFTNSTAVEATDGRLWFATDNGLAWIDPSQIKKNLVPPPVSIMAITTKRGSHPIHSNLHFGPHTTSIQIAYTALSFSVPERVKFRYKLEGVDADWQDVGIRRQANYSNLGPGAYRFLVTASNNDGVWNQQGASLEFYISPAFYQTASFRVASGIIFLALVWILYQLRLRHLTRRSQQLAAINANLEFQIHERKRIEEDLTEAQMELTRVNRIILVGETAATIAHEVNQPLAAAVTNAKTGLRWLAAHPPDIEEAREALGRIVSDSMRAGEVIHRIRSLIGRAPLRKDPLDVNEAINEAISLVDGEIRKHRVSLKLQLSDQLPQILADRIQLQQVLLNLIRNALEAMASENPRELEIGSQLGDSRDVLITVRDSGSGLDPKAINKLFNHFYTTKAEGMGMGLTISRSIIEAHGGRLWATANFPRGAVFHFTVPIEE
jgi:signal transduction histidine kinase/ligand-binding sensor domain-containing protein